MYKIWWFREKPLILYGEKRRNDEEHKKYYTLLPSGVLACRLEGAGLTHGWSADAEADVAAAGRTVITG